MAAGVVTRTIIHLHKRRRRDFFSRREAPKLFAWEWNFIANVQRSKSICAEMQIVNKARTRQVACPGSEARVRTCTGAFRLLLVCVLLSHPSEDICTQLQFPLIQTNHYWNKFDVFGLNWWLLNYSL